MTDDDKPPSRGWFAQLGHLISGEPSTKSELLKQLHDAADHDLIDHNSLTMIESIMTFSDQRVRDVMIPRAQIVALQSDAPFEEIISIVVNSGHSRFPVIGENKDEILGILLAKELLKYRFMNQSDFIIKNCLRPVIFVPESKRLNTLLQEFRIKRNHMAIAVDEYGGVSGLVTIEDVLEQIVGEIEDELDPSEECKIHEVQQGVYHVKASMEVPDFNQYFNLNWAEDEFDTLGGLVTQSFSHVPTVGEETSINNLHFKVLEADARKLKLLEVTIRT